jgi:hypothetical protein
MSLKRGDVLVYSGQHTEAVFLKSLLEGSGIASTLWDLSESGGDDVVVYVTQSDVQHATPLVEDFRSRGIKTPKFIGNKSV